MSEKAAASPPIVYRWDLDKTYLRTEFDTLRDLVRTAFEAPALKRAVPGATALLREIRATKPHGVYILSGSPEQMRRALEAKLRLDGVTWDGLVLKPSLSNLLRGRFRFVRDQVGYKLRALLDARVRLGSSEADEILFGDDAEADAFVYSMYADICAGAIERSVLTHILELARVHEDDAVSILRLAHSVPRRRSCRRVFIHLDRTSSAEDFRGFGQRVCSFYNYFQPALVLVEDGLIEVRAALRVGAELVLQHGFGPDALRASFENLVERKFVTRKTAQLLHDVFQDTDDSIGTSNPFSDATATIESLVRSIDPKKIPERDSAADQQGIQDFVPDYVALFSSDRARARAAKERARARR